MAFATVLIGVLVCGGCSTPPHLPSHRGPQMDAAEMRRYYDYPRKPIEAVARDTEARSRWTRQVIEFEVTWPADLNAAPVERARQIVAAKPGSRRARNASLEFMVRIDYFRPNSAGPHPLIVMSPLMGGNHVIVDDVARYFAGKGFCVALVHRKRNSVNEAEGLDQVERYLRLSVIRVRQALDWALQQPEVDATRVASFGISYGAIINAMAAGTEPRIHCHVFALSGGDLPGIIFNTAEPQIRRQVAKVARARGWSSQQLMEELQRALKSDPLNAAPLLDRKKVLLITAQFDSVVGAQFEKRFWQALGKPERIVVPLGHYTAALSLPFVKNEALRFLQKQFGIPMEELLDPTVFDAHRSKPY